MFMIGSDPEFFITRNGEAFPIVGLLGGTKEKPRPLGPRGYAVQEDNVMAEYNIPPCASPGRFADAIQNARGMVMELLWTRMPDARVLPATQAFFPHSMLDTPQAQVFGCSPDFDAYQQGRPLPRFQPHTFVDEGGAWRFAGGHVHLGYKDDLQWSPPEFVVAALCDLQIGLPAIAHNLDLQGKRREYYGSPGRYRPTPYGIEYRTLGNHWIMNTNRSEYVGRMAFSVLDTLRRGEQFVRTLYNDIPWADVTRAISTQDNALAISLRDYAQDCGLEVL